MTRPVTMHPRTTASGLLLACAAAPLGIADGGSRPFLATDVLALGASISAALLTLLAGLSIVRHQGFGRVSATLGLFAVLWICHPHLLVSPLAALASLVGATAFLVLLWRVGAPLLELSRIRRRPVSEGRAQGAGIAALALWLAWTLGGSERSLVDSLAVGWAMAVSTCFGLGWALRSLSRQRVRAWVVLGAFGISGTLAPLFWGEWWWLLSVFAVPAAVVALLVRRMPQSEIEQASWWEPLIGHPERLFVGTFAALCAGGSILLALPQSASSGQSVGFTDALFTSTSAVCVTGLIVLDTPVDFSAFGQFVILLLIQVGGLGIMTFSTAALWALGQRMSLRHERAVASLISAQDRGSLFTSAKRILQLTVVTEAVGATLLSLAFLQRGDSPALAIWRGVFTSISAFCNAGFALQSDSLIPYQTSPLILHTVAVLIILGGLSPLAVFAIPKVLRRAPVPVSAQARLALWAAVVLLVGGFVFMLAFEWKDSLAGLDLADKVHNAWFQSVTLRTAGFNSVDITLVRPATFILMLVWMFIGGSPGGTAGGVKTTTISILLLSVANAIRGQWVLEVFGRRIPERTRAKAAVVLSIAASTGLSALIAILLTQDMSLLWAMFEVVSALGTVGLSIGGTGALDGIGKAIIIVCMFVGRVGGLTLLMFLSGRRAPATLGRPPEEIDVG